MENSQPNMWIFEWKTVNQIFWGSREIFPVFFRSFSGKKLWEKIMEKITGPRHLMLNILLLLCDHLAKLSKLKQ